MKQLTNLITKFSFKERTILGKFCGIFAIAWFTHIFFRSQLSIDRPDIFFMACNCLGFLVFKIDKK